MITMGMAFANNVGKFTAKSLGTSRGGRPAGTLPQTFTCKTMRGWGCERQTDSPPGKSERQNLREERAGKGFYPLHVESQLPSDNSVDNNDDSWPVKWVMS